jgi:hypothetical protein
VFDIFEGTCDELRFMDFRDKLLPVSPDAAEALFRVVDAAYEKRSIALSSKIHPSGFDELMPKRWRPRPSSGSCTTPT